MKHAPSSFGRLLDLLIPARRRSRHLAQENLRLESFLRAVPVEYCGWDKAGMQAISPGFCAMLGIQKVTSIEDIQAAVTAGDAAALESLFARLKQTGEGFDIGVNTVVGRKTLKIFGKQGAVSGSDNSFAVLWLYDITDFAQAALRGMEAVAAVEKRESELRQAVNALPFPVWMRNHKLDLVWCNKAYARMIDATVATAVADQKELPLGDALKTGVRALAQKAIAQSAPEHGRGHAIVDGQRRLFDVAEVPYENGQRLVGVALDITREEELEQGYKRLVKSHKESLEQLRTAIAMFDADARLEFYNSAYEQVTGMPGSWLDTSPRMSDIIDKMRELRRLPEQADYKLYKQNWAARFTGLLDPYEEMQYLPDGTALRMIAVPRPQGGLLLTLEDVTSRLQLETSFNTLMAVQQETMDNLAEGIAVFGEDGRLKLSNQAFAQIWRLQPEDLTETAHVSKLVEKTRGLFAAKDSDEAGRIMLGNALERSPRRGRLVRADGSIVQYAVMPLPDGNILNAWSDVTDTVRVEQALMEKNAALEEAERLKTNFLANVSYQLRTPLNTMMGFAEMLQQQYFGKLNERQLDYTNNMIESGQRLVSLINDILDLSTIEAGYLKLYPSQVNLGELMERVAALTADWARKQRLEISVECEDAALAITADERRLKQVLLNLISNAINYSPQGGRVTLSAKRAGGYIEMAVRDTGIGIPAEDIARVFTPFDKITSGKTQRRSGAGLGLTLVKNIVELHGGSVQVESREGAGTLVVCRLPIEMAIAAENVAATA